MHVERIIWIPDIVDKLTTKHGVMLTEVEEVLHGQPFLRRMKRGHRPGEDVYAALGQTAKGVAMSIDSPAKGTSRSEIDEYISLGEFWDTHSLADAWDDTEPADMEFAPVLGRRMLVPQTTLTLDLIATDPAIRNGQPCIAGTGLRVAELVIAHLFHRRTPDKLAADYELSLAQVYPALTYYYANRYDRDRAIRTQLDRARMWKETIRHTYGDGLAPALPKRPPIRATVTYLRSN